MNSKTDYIMHKLANKQKVKALMAQGLSKEEAWNRAYPNSNPKNKGVIDPAKPDMPKIAQNEVTRKTEGNKTTSTATLTGVRNVGQKTKRIDGGFQTDKAIQLNTPQGKRYYEGIGRSRDMGFSGDKARLDAIGKYMNSPADSLTTQDYNAKYNAPEKPAKKGWFRKKAGWENTIDKLAAKADKDKTYPLSRAYMFQDSVRSLGLSRAIRQRAAQGRANMGQSGVTTNEALVFKNIKLKDNHPASKKTYPISRAATSVPGGAAIGGLSGGVMGGALGGAKGAVLGTLLGAGTLGGSMALDRGLHARASLGRARKGRKGTLPTDKKILKSLKNKKA